MVDGVGAGRLDSTGTAWQVLGLRNNDISFEDIWSSSDYLYVTMVACRRTWAGGGAVRSGAT